MSKEPKKTYQFGLSCEKVAENFLRLKGYRVLKSRYKTKVGEVDIVALKGKSLVFVEVKARKKDELIEVILRPRQVERIKNAALMFVAENKDYQDFDMRFDFILFSGARRIPRHYEAYF